MQILLKFLLKSILENKLRTIIIIMSIAFSTAIFFGSLTLKNSLYSMQVEQLKSVTGNADFMVVTKRERPVSYFRINNNDINELDLEYLIGVVEETALLKAGNNSERIQLKGLDLDDIQKMNPINFVEKDYKNSFQGKEVIISNKFSKEFRLEIGDVIELKLKDNTNFFKIYGIANDSGFFMKESDSSVLIMPKDTLSAISGFPRMFTAYYIKLSENADSDKSLNKLSQDLARFMVVPVLPDEEVGNYIRRTTTSFMQITVIVIFLSLFIIYSIFKILSLEKLPVLGTLISIGTTRKKISALVFIEIFCYGMIGGILGCLMGIGILKGIVFIITPPYLSGTIMNVSKFGLIDFVISFSVANFIVFSGAFVPMHKILKLPAKEILFVSDKDRQTEKAIKRTITGIFLIVVSFLIPNFSINKFEAYLYIASALVLLIAFIVLIPDAIRLFIKFVEAVNVVMPINEIIISAKNIKNNKNVIINITLLSISISVLIMINVLSNSVLQTVSSSYGNKNFDIQLAVSNADRETEAMLNYIEGVKSVYGVYEDRYVEVVGRNQRIHLVQGVGSDNFFDYMSVGILGDRAKLINELSKERSIILTNTYRDTLKVKKGDFITLDMRRDKVSYKVIGFMDSLESFGSYGLVWDTYLRSDTKDNYFSRFFIKTSGDPSSVSSLIDSHLRQREHNVSVIKDLKENDLKSNEKNFLLMKLFCYVAIIVGGIGIANNFTVSYLERKHSLAIFRSIGMSKKKGFVILTIESVLGGLIGGMIGVVAGMGLTRLVPRILSLYGVPININLSIKSIFIYTLTGVFVSLAASVIPIIMVFKEKILQALRYE